MVFIIRIIIIIHIIADGIDVFPTVIMVVCLRKSTLLERNLVVAELIIGGNRSGM